MTRYLLSQALCGLALLCSTSTFAADTKAHVPPYAHVKNPTCTCDCDNRLIFTKAKVDYKTLVKWSQEAAIASYSYGFGNYDTALKKASQYYTPSGWESFSAALSASNNLNIVQKNKLLVKAIPIGKAKIELVKNAKKQKTWKIELPMLVKYENSRTTTHDSLKVHMTVVQQNAKAGVQGLGIASFIATRIS